MVQSCHKKNLRRLLGHICVNRPLGVAKRLFTSNRRRDDREDPDKEAPDAGEITSVDDVKGVNEVWDRVSFKEFHRLCLLRRETHQPFTLPGQNLLPCQECLLYERHPLVLDPIHQERAQKVKGDFSVVHVEDLEELRDATPRAVTNRNSRKENHLVVVDVVLYGPLVERKAHVVKPHKDVHDEVFQNRHKLWNVFPSNLVKKRKTAIVSVLDFPQFTLQKLAQRGDVVPQILEKAIFCLEDRVYIAKNFKHEQRKAKMCVDEGISERERDVFDWAKGVFRV